MLVKPMKEEFGADFMEKLNHMREEAPIDKTKGFRINKDKPEISLCPPELILAVAEVLTKSAEENGGKYPKHNWAKGMAWMECYDALQRHLLSFVMKKDIDAESGLHTLKHAAADLAMLIAYVERGIGTDNRP